jgi:hypothetical protein
LGDPHAAIQAIPMQSLNEKEHDKKELTILIPDTTDVPEEFMHI